MKPSEKNKSIRILIPALLIPLMTGGLSAYLTSGDMTIYETMNRPALAPPGWLFPIVWTILYLMMGAASYLVINSDAEKKTKRKALLLYALQLIMNFFWSIIFFTYERYLISFIWLLIMWVLILACMLHFGRIRRIAGFMMGVLFLWTTFAAYLNLAWYLISLQPGPA